MTSSGSNVSVGEGSCSGWSLGLPYDSVSRVLGVTIEVTRECREILPKNTLRVIFLAGLGMIGFMRRFNLRPPSSCGHNYQRLGLTIYKFLTRE